MPFFSEHKAQFQELREMGELYAVNGHNENLDFGPWHVSCNLTDSDIASRLNTRFRAAAQRAAMAAGAPYRVNRLDWWIGKLTHGKPLPSIKDLIQRSAEYCEELETRAVELGRASPKPDGVVGLYRDRYPCDWGEPYSLYDGQPRAFSDPKTEFEFWSEYIWSGFNGDIAKLDQIDGPRKRQDKETRKEFKDRVMQRVGFRYARMERTIRGLSYDLAVLQANYIIDRGLRGDAAIRACQDESAELLESVMTFGGESSKRLGLSFTRREKGGVDPAKPFREVAEDLRHLTSAIPAEAPPGILEHAVSDSFDLPRSSVADRTASQMENKSPVQPESPRKRGRPAIAIEIKRRAWEAKQTPGTTNKDVAKILYGTARPTSRQVQNVTTILRYYQKSAGMKNS